tara:strand:- start:5522 stop:5869 length:348 start_codon:yes stop_codon:yes gene_type:complete
MAQYEDISIDAGTDVIIRLELTNEDGSTKDLTGYGAAGQIRKTYNNDSSTSFTCAFETPRTGGVLNASLSNIQTSTFTSNRYVYDIEISHEDSSANTLVERILEGQLLVTPSVTR